ncbi:MAG: endonuclease/exonuclease/phosphatase family protein [Ignavibacteriaceae bacterium]|nr:endonuclease/exonuclease/phosphatase family protein [Ignavibacteriaceae bacterium]
MSKLLSIYFLFAVTVFSQTYDTVSIMSYNILNYPGTTGSQRNPSFRLAVNTANPDIVALQEMQSQAGVVSFLNFVLNFDSTTYTAGVFIDGPDTDNAIFFKTSKFQFLENRVIKTSLRDINAFYLKYIETGDTLLLISLHLKASNSTSDQQQRAREVDSLRKFTNALAPGTPFFVLGDFNIYTANEQAYIKLKQIMPDVEGHFYDPLNMPGTWNSQIYAIYHTQSPRTRSFGGGSTGGMDDRFDMILFSKSVFEPGGITYVPNSTVAYGNDGLHYNDSINRPPNTAVGQEIADALHNAADHIPVIVKVIIPVVTTSVKDDNLPSDFVLSQNFPNPFNPSTGIVYSVSSPGDVRFDIYNSLGERVESRAFYGVYQGQYQFNWNAGGYASGLYFLKANSY